MSCSASSRLSNNVDAATIDYVPSRSSPRALLFIAAILAAIAYPRLGHAASQLDFESETPTEILLAQRAIADSVSPSSVGAPIASAAGSPIQTEEERVHKSAGKAFPSEKRTVELKDIADPVEVASIDWR